MKFVVDRKDWVRGEDGVESRLFNLQGKMCCLGFISEQLGESLNKLEDIGFPENIINPCLQVRKHLLDYDETRGQWCNKNWVNDAGKINDESDICDEEREQKLKDLIRENGYKLEFIN